MRGIYIYLYVICIFNHSALTVLNSAETNNKECQYVLIHILNGMASKVWIKWSYIVHSGLCILCVCIALSANLFIWIYIILYLCGSTKQTNDKLIYIYMYILGSQFLVHVPFLLSLLLYTTFEAFLANLRVQHGQYDVFPCRICFIIMLCYNLAEALGTCPIRILAYISDTRNKDDYDLALFVAARRRFAAHSYNLCIWFVRSYPEPIHETCNYVYVWRVFFFVLCFAQCSMWRMFLSNYVTNRAAYGIINPSAMSIISSSSFFLAGI